MNLRSRYSRDLEVFSVKHGCPVDRYKEDESLVLVALDTAKKLFHGGPVEQAYDGSILVALSNGSILALVCLPDKEVGAFATRIGQTYFVAINFGVIRLLFTLSLSVWKDHRFLKYVKSGIRDFDNLGVDFVPSGFEEVILRSKLEQSSNIQHTAFYKCFEQAINFFWLHEIAHVFLGHVDVICAKQSKYLGVLEEFLAIADFDDDELDDSVGIDIPYSAIEMQADRSALDKIFVRLHQRIRADQAGELELIATTIGCNLFPLSLHGYNLLQNKSDLAKYHPPLWFRSDEVMRAESNAANEQWYKSMRHNQRFEVIRTNQKALVRLGLSGLSSLHPMYGDWLAPVRESLRQSEYNRVLKEATTAFQPWASEFERYICTVNPEK